MSNAMVRRNARTRTDDQTNNLKKVIGVLHSIPEHNRQIAIALTTAYMDGVEAGIMFTKKET